VGDGLDELDYFRSTTMICTWVKNCFELPLDCIAKCKFL